MSPKFAYIFIHRNMGNGYTDACPKCSFWKNWIFDRFLKPRVDSNFSKKSENIPGYEMIEMELESDVISWHNYYAMKIERKPDEKCSDPLASGRLAKFTMYLFLEGKPAVLPAPPFHDFTKTCIDIGYEILSPGQNEALRIQIPNKFFNHEEN